MCRVDMLILKLRENITEKNACFLCQSLNIFLFKQIENRKDFKILFFELTKIFRPLIFRIIVTNLYDFYVVRIESGGRHHQKIY